MLGIEYKEQIQHDISLIADLDHNCFKHAHTREEIRAMKKYIQWLKDLDKERKTELESRSKELSDKKKEVEELETKLKAAEVRLEKET